MEQTSLGYWAQLHADVTAQNLAKSHPCHDKKERQERARSQELEERISSMEDAIGDLVITVEWAVAEIRKNRPAQDALRSHDGLTLENTRVNALDIDGICKCAHQPEAVKAERRRCADLARKHFGSSAIIKEIESGAKVFYCGGCGKVYHGDPKSEELITCGDCGISGLYDYPPPMRQT